MRFMQCYFGLCGFLRHISYVRTDGDCERLTSGDSQRYRDVERKDKEVYI